MSQTDGLSALDPLEILTEEKSGNRCRIECPPTWGQLTPEDVRSEVSRGSHNIDERQAEVSSVYIATGWGTSF